MVSSLLIVSAASLFVALFAHGVLLLHDGAYGDSVILEGMLKPGRKHYMIRSSSELGRPLPGRILAATAAIGNKPLFYRTLAVASIWLIGVFTYLACRATGLLGEQACVAVALLTIGYSGNQMLMDYSIALFYYFFQIFFLAGVATLFLAAYAPPFQAVLLCLVTVGLLYLGFQMESHLSYFYAAPLLLVTTWLMTPQGHSGIQPLVVAGAMSAYPVFHWLLKERLTPRGGDNQEYNRFRFDPKRTRKLVVRTVTHGLLGAVLEPFRFVLSRRWGWLVLAPASLCAWGFAALGIGAVHISRGTSLGLLAFGTVLLALGAIPYILVQQPVGVRGWATKNNVLIALPAALLLTGLLSLAVQEATFAAILGFMLVFNAAYLSLTHLHWVAVWAKHRSLLQALKRLPEAREFTTFAYTDTHPVSGDCDQHKENYNLFIVFLLDTLWGGLQRMCIVEPKVRDEGYSRLELEIAIKSTTVDYMLTNVDRHGPQAALQLQAGDLDLSPTSAALRYLWHRWVSPKGLDAFLQDFTQVTLTPLPRPEEQEQKRPWSPGIAPFVERWKVPAEQALRGA